MVRLASLLVALAALTASASAQGVGLSARASTLGVGADLSVPVTARLNVRATANLFAFHQGGLLGPDDHGTDGLFLRYDADLGLGSAGVLADWHPFGNTFRITAGALYNLNEVVAELAADREYVDASLNKTFSVERVGTVRAVMAYDQPVAPYLGLGLGNLTRGRLGLSAEVGAAYVGAPSIELTGTGLIGGTADPANVVALERGLDSFRFHPVVSLGVKTSLPRR